MGGVSDLHRRDRLRRRLSLTAYVEFKLARTRGRAAWFNFFVRPLGAPSFADFWRRWNPVYGYFLYYYAYRPLSRVAPRSAAVLLTFVLCGLLLHDVPAWLAARRVLPPGGIVAFVLFGLGAILSEKLHMDLSRWPVAARALVNLAYLVACVAIMLAIVRGLA